MRGVAGPGRDPTKSGRRGDGFYGRAMAHLGEEQSPGFVWW